jgi:hypothetical protein
MILSANYNEMEDYDKKFLNRVTRLIQLKGLKHLNILDNVSYNNLFNKYIYVSVITSL